MASCDRLSTPKLSFASALSSDAKSIYIAGGSIGESKATNECEVFDIDTKKWTKLPTLNQPRFSASLIVCENEDIYCFGGIDNDPESPSRFLSLKSIETMCLSDETKQWEILKITLPFKTSSPGAINLGHRAFVVFGGWNKSTLNRSAVIRLDEGTWDYVIEEAGDMVNEDTFSTNGLVSRDSKKSMTVIFGTSYPHVFNEKTRRFC